MSIRRMNNIMDLANRGITLKYTSEPWPDSRCKDFVNNLLHGKDRVAAYQALYLEYFLRSRTPFCMGGVTKLKSFAVMMHEEFPVMQGRDSINLGIELTRGPLVRTVIYCRSSGSKIAPIVKLIQPSLLKRCHSTPNEISLMRDLVVGTLNSKYLIESSVIEYPLTVDKVMAYLLTDVSIKQDEEI